MKLVNARSKPLACASEPCDVVLLRVDRAVEHHRPDLGREQLGVGGAEQRAVGEAQVGQLLVADRGADRVHVLGGLLGGEEWQLVAVLRAAAVAIFLFSATKASKSAWLTGSGVGGEAGVLVGVADALDRVGPADPARVEADDVELVGDRGRQAAERWPKDR